MPFHPFGSVAFGKGSFPERICKGRHPFPHPLDYASACQDGESQRRQEEIFRGIEESKRYSRKNILFLSRGKYLIVSGDPQKPGFVGLETISGPRKDSFHVTHLVHDCDCKETYCHHVWAAVVFLDRFIQDDEVLEEIDETDDGEWTEGASFLKYELLAFHASKANPTNRVDETVLDAYEAMAKACPDVSKDVGSPYNQIWMNLAAALPNKDHVLSGWFESLPPEKQLEALLFYPEEPVLRSLYLSTVPKTYDKFLSYAKDKDGQVLAFVMSLLPDGPLKDELALEGRDNLPLERMGDVLSKAYKEKKIGIGALLDILGKNEKRIREDYRAKAAIRHLLLEIAQSLPETDKDLERIFVEIPACVADFPVFDACVRKRVTLTSEEAVRKALSTWHEGLEFGLPDSTGLYYAYGHRKKDEIRNAFAGILLRCGHGKDIPEEWYADLSTRCRIDYYPCASEEVRRKIRTHVRGKLKKDLLALRDCTKEEEELFEDMAAIVHFLGTNDKAGLRKFLSEEDGTIQAFLFENRNADFSTAVLEQYKERKMLPASILAWKEKED